MSQTSPGIRMIATAQVEHDLDRLRQALRASALPYSSCFDIQDWRPFVALGIDWALIAVAVMAVKELGLLAILPALLLVGNRQRALGNMLHEAAHRNLMRDERRNDLLANIAITPALLTDLERYRHDHMRHHRHLGSVTADPDLIDLGSGSIGWLAAWVKLASRRSVWWSNFAGHLAELSRIRYRSVVVFVLWWVLVLAGIALVSSTATAVCFIGLWFAARATVFHAITVFRELCDHYGLGKLGVFGRTRDLTGTGAMRWLVHPRNNGYHLTHHLMPAVPYYHLPRVHQLFLHLTPFREHAVVCRSYFVGRDALTRKRPPETTGRL